MGKITLSLMSDLNRMVYIFPFTHHIIQFVMTMTASPSDSNKARSGFPKGPIFPIAIPKIIENITRPKTFDPDLASELISQE